jgi:heptosyltransferase-2
MSNLLVVMPSWIGDIVMATPVLRALRQRDPDGKLTVTVRPGLETVLEGTPFVDRIETASLRGLLGPIAEARRLRALGADTVLLLPNSFRAGLFAKCTGAPRRIGFKRDGRGWLLTEAIKPPSSSAIPCPTLDEYGTLVEQAFDITITDRRPELGTTEEDESAADRLLAGLEPPFILLNPGANRTDKRWPAASFARFADQLKARRACSILVNGSPAEAELVEEVCRQAQAELVSLPERGSTLGALKAVTRRAALLVTNDTGPRHLAAALGTPSVALFGPTDRRWTILPGVRERHLVAEPFLTEDHVADQHPKACAIDRIAVGDVLHAAQELLEGSPS